MRLRSLALAAIPAAFLGVMASAPTASAWSSGNCPVGSFCVWPEFWYGETDMTPSLTTQSEWTGSAPGHIFYNNTSKDMTMTYVIAQDDGQSVEHTACVNGITGSYFTVPVSVTELTWREDDGTPCY